MGAVPSRPCNLSALPHNGSGSRAHVTPSWHPKSQRLWCGKATTVMCHGPRALNSRTLSSANSRGEKSQIKMPAGGLLPRTSRLGGLCSPCPHPAFRVCVSNFLLFTRTPAATDQGPPRRPRFEHLIKDPVALRGAGSQSLRLYVGDAVRSRPRNHFSESFRETHQARGSDLPFL